MPRAARPASAVRVPQDRTTAQSWASNPAVRARMQRQQTRDTQPELAVRRLLHAAGLRYRVDAPPLPALRRRADVVFGPAKVALFVDGCFWHGCPDHGSRTTRSNPTYWAEKVRRNRERDHHTDTLLEAVGWISIRAWEHEDPRDVAERVILVVKSRRTSAIHPDASVPPIADTVG
jgi:DNA mismatch endonuclease (patch repair protein)